MQQKHILLYVYATIYNKIHDQNTVMARSLQ